MTYLGIPKFAMSSVLDAFVFKKKRVKTVWKEVLTAYYSTF